MILLESKENKAVKTAVKLIKSAKFRRQSERFVAEGLRLCEDALRSGAQVDTLFVTEKAMEKYPDSCARLADAADKSFIVTEELFKLMSDTQTPQGVLCVIKTLDKISQFGTIKNGGKYLALDNVQDPNNLGAILRSAEAFGVDGVVLSADCCDMYNPKVVRGSMGAVFRVPFTVCETVAGWLGAHPQVHSFAAVVDKTALPITEITFTPPCIAVIGNEGNGLKPETVSACQQAMTIPMNGKAESLNASAAASVIIWEMVK